MNASPMINAGSSAGKLLTAQEAAACIGLSAKCLANYRCTGEGPAFYKLGRYVRYDENEIQVWMRSRRYTSTSQEAAA